MASGDAAIDGKAFLGEISKSADILRKGTPRLKLIGATTSALGESRLEAVSNSQQYIDDHKRMLDENLPQIENSEREKLFQDNPEYFELTRDAEGNMTNNLTSEG